MRDETPNLVTLAKSGMRLGSYEELAVAVRSFADRIIRIMLACLSTVSGMLGLVIWSKDNRFWVHKYKPFINCSTQCLLSTSINNTDNAYQTYLFSREKIFLKLLIFEKNTFFRWSVETRRVVLHRGQPGGARDGIKNRVVHRDKLTHWLQNA